MEMTERVKFLLAALLGVLISALPPSLYAQGASESGVFSAGVKEFDDGSYSLAEKEFGWVYQRVSAIDAHPRGDPL